VTPGACHVVVVGAGPTGFTAAYQLARRGATVRIIDRAPERSRATKALGIQHRTLELLDRLGITDRITTECLPTTTFKVFSERHPIARIDVGRLDTPYPFLVMVPQHDTEALLEDRLRELGGSVERGVELTRLAESGDGIDALVTRADGADNVVRCRDVVGCDGPHSRVGKQLGVRFDGAELEEQFAVVDVRVDWSLPYDELFAFLQRGTSSPLSNAPSAAPRPACLHRPRTARKRRVRSPTQICVAQTPM
jgi:2-polyprenyl-6-methoxyphenol hydroxylase-like FAD-dependent oxidoreductase